MKKRRIIPMLLALLLTLVLCSCGGAPAPQAVSSEQQLAIRIGTNYRADSIGYQMLQDFGYLLQEKSGNTIVVQLYASGEWSKPESFVDYVKLGSLEMVCLEPAEMNRLQPAYALYQQPYLFTDLPAVQRYIGGEAGAKALRTLPQDYYGVGFVPDSYQYLLQNGATSQWISYGDLKVLGQTRALEGTMVFDLRAIYSLQSLVSMRTWWETLTEEQQNWVQESFQEALSVSFAHQTEKNPTQALLSSGVAFSDGASYTNQYLQQRETYFAEHSDSLTAYWRPVTAPAPTEAGEEATS